MKKPFLYLVSILLSVLIILHLPSGAEAKSFKDHIRKNLKGWQESDLKLTNGSNSVIPSMPYESDDFIILPGATLWYLNGGSRYGYNAQNKQIIRISHGLANALVSKDSTFYDAQGHLSYNAYFLHELNNWELKRGYRNQRTYNSANQLIEVIHEDFNNGNWTLNSKETYFYDATGRPIEETYHEFVANTWVATGKMIMTYSGSLNSPTILTLMESVNGNWVNLERFINITWHDFAKFQPLTYEVQDWANGVWVNSRKGDITYDAFGSSILVEQELKLGVWVNTTRITEAYDNKFNFTTSRIESWHNNTWHLDYETSHVLTYNSADQIIERIYRTWDTSSNSWINNKREVYSNFRILGINMKLDPVNINVFPNPAADFISIEGFISQAVTLQVTDLSGKVLINKFLKPGINKQLSLENLSPGIYMLFVSTEKGEMVQKIVKN